MAEILIFIHRINATVCSVITIIGCLLLTFLIIHRTVMEMKSYAKILLQGCMMDLVFASSMLISAPIILLKDSTAYLILNSIFAEYIDGTALRFAITLIWVFAFSIIIPQSPIQFVYRYLVFCKKRDIAPLHYVLYLCIPIGSTVIYIILVFFACFPRPDDVQIANSAIGELFIENGSEVQDVRVGLRADANNMILRVVLFDNFITNITAYTTISFCTFKMWRFFQTSSMHLQEKTKEAQAQITRALFCQMISPIVLVMLPLVYVVGSMALNMANPKVSIALNMGFAWMPMVNCFSTTFFVRPYRIAVAQLLCGRCFRISESWTSDSANHLARVAPRKTLTAFVSIVKNTSSPQNSR